MKTVFVFEGKQLLCNLAFGLVLLMLLLTVLAEMLGGLLFRGSRSQESFKPDDRWSAQSPRLPFCWD